MKQVKDLTKRIHPLAPFAKDGEKDTRVHPYVLAINEKRADVLSTLFCALSWTRTRDPLINPDRSGL